MRPAAKAKSTCGLWRSALVRTVGLFGKIGSGSVFVSVPASFLRMVAQINWDVLRRFDGRTG